MVTCQVCHGLNVLVVFCLLYNWIVVNTTHDRSVVFAGFLDQ